MNLTDEVIFLNLNGGNSEEEKESTPHQTRLNGVYATWGGGGVDTRGCSSEILNLTPKGDHLKLFVALKGDQSGSGLSKFWPLNKTR